MSLIEANRVDDLARSLFDTAVLPLARAREAADQPGYYPLSPDHSAASYFTPVEQNRTGRPQAYDFPGGGQAAGLIAALEAFWTQHGDIELAAMVPALMQIAEAMQAERQQGSGDVDIYCYTMF